jgi:hypothetical protein
MCRVTVKVASAATIMHQCSNPIIILQTALNHLLPADHPNLHVVV